MLHVPHCLFRRTCLTTPSLLFKSLPRSSLCRSLSTTRARLIDASLSTPKTEEHSTSNPDWKTKDIYQGPLTQTFRRLKILSLSSFAATTTISPFFFIVESNLPTVARISLACIAVATSAVSTAMVTYFTRPYVTKMRKIKTPEGGQELELTTYTLFLNPRITRVCPSP